MTDRQEITATLFALLSEGLHPDRNAMPVALPDPDCQFYALCVRQGITALVWDGIRKLRAEGQLARDLKLQWAVQVEQLEKRHRKQELTAVELAALFAKHDMRMLVLKGIGLSHDYPSPAHRECGDIDLWLFGNFEAGNRLLRDAGAKIIDDVPKHTEMSWHGVTVENHRNFLNISRNRKEKQIDALLRELLEREGSVETAEGYCIPSATFNAIYLLRHAALHFLKEGIVLRHVCDWACFRERHWGRVDRALFDEVVKRYRMERFAALMTAAAIRCCGLREDMPEHDPHDLDLFIGNMLGYSAEPKNEAVLPALIRKCLLPYDNRWRFKLLGMSLAGYYRNVLRAQWREKFTLFKP